MKEQSRKSKGITLIALVITIIVLLVLAGISIVTLMGEGGLLSKATQSQKQTNEARSRRKFENCNYGIAYEVL